MLSNQYQIPVARPTANKWEMKNGEEYYANGEKSPVIHCRDSKRHAEKPEKIHQCIGIHNKKRCEKKVGKPHHRCGGVQHDDETMSYYAQMALAKSQSMIHQQPMSTSLVVHRPVGGELTQASIATKFSDMSDRLVAMENMQSQMMHEMRQGFGTLSQGQQSLYFQQAAEGERTRDVVREVGKTIDERVMSLTELMESLKTQPSISAFAPGELLSGVSAGVVSGGSSSSSSVAHASTPMSTPADNSAGAGVATVSGGSSSSC